MLTKGNRKACAANHVTLRQTFFFDHLLQKSDDKCLSPGLRYFSVTEFNNKRLGHKFVKHRQQKIFFFIKLKQDEVMENVFFPLFRL